MNFDALYLQNVDAIYKYLYRRTLDRMVAEDLTSITFLKAFESFRSFDPSRGPFLAWVYRIARNTLLDSVRAKRTAVSIDDVWGLASNDDTAAQAERSLDLKKIKEALAHLSSDQREVVLLRIWEGLPYKEIAAITGKTENNAKVLFSRAMSELRTQLPALLFLLIFPTKL